MTQQVRCWILIGISTLLLSLTNTLVSSHREHKVHNIVLYPDKHSWCKTTPIKQVVAYAGCNSVEIDNNVCVGACFSYSIPRTSPSSRAPGELIKPYCDSCQPSSVVWQHVTLVCEGDENIEERVQMIENCSCSTCDLGSRDNPHGDDLSESSGDGTDSFRKPSLLDVPELMDLMLETHNTRRNQNESAAMNRTSASGNLHTHATDPALNERLLMLIKQFSEGDNEKTKLGILESSFDRVALKELLHHVEGDDHHVDPDTLSDLVRKVEDTEHILVDLTKLKHILGKLAREEWEKENPEVHYHHEAHRHHQHNHQHNHHQNHPYIASTSDGESLQIASKMGHANELAAEKLDPTLDVSPHHLKPALEGTEISYHENIVLPEDEEKLKHQHHIDKQDEK